MKETMGIILAIFVVFSACTFAANAVKPDGEGKPKTLPPVSTDDDLAPEGILLPTDRTDNTPASDNAPAFIGDQGPQIEPPIDWLPCI